MTKPRIDQLLAGFADGDAISNAALIMRDVVRALGHASDIFAPTDRVSPPMRASCRPLEAYAPAPEDVTLYHYGLAAPTTPHFLRARGKKILVYHNITPAEYFDGFDDTVAAQLRDARVELCEVAGHADAVWAASRFNASELEGMGISPVHVFELPFSTNLLDTPPDEELLRRRQAPMTTILFVGRIAPNKRVEDLIQAFAWYHKTINPLSRLFVVGSNRSCPRYYTLLRMMAGDLDIPNICLEGFASQAGLSVYYQLSDLYVCTSEHEGYCLPLLEAMYKGLPVISRIAGGTPEAMDGAGVLYDDLNHRELAELFHNLLSDGGLRERVLVGQRERVQRALSRDLTGEIRALLDTAQ